MQQTQPKGFLRIILKLCALVGGMTGFAAAALQVWEYSSIDVPAIAFEVSCGSPDENESALIGSIHDVAEIEKLIGFVQAHNGKPIFASVRVQKNCNACGCRRLEQSKNWEAELERIYEPDSIHPNAPKIVPEHVILYDRVEFEDGPLGGESSRKRGFNIFLMQSGLYVDLTLPRENELDSSTRYRIGRWGDLQSYNGIFIAHFEGTIQGTQIGFMVPVESNAEYSKVISCYQELMNENSIKELELRRPSLFCHGASFWSIEDINNHFGWISDPEHELD